MRVHKSIFIDRAADDVFTFVADRSNDPLWRAELVSASVVGDVREGVGMRLHQVVSYKGRTGEASIEVTEIEPGRRICFRAHGGVRAHGCYEVQSEGDGARLAMSATVELKGAAAMLERYVRQALEEVVEGDLERLRAVLESDKGARGDAKL